MRSMLVIILISLKVVIGNDHYWRDYIGTIPSDALEDPDTGLILAQVSLVEKCGGLCPAGLNPSSKKATAECKANEISMTDNIKVLCTMNPERYYWEWVNVHNMTATTKHGLVKGGYEVSLDADVYYGKVFRNGSWHLGKVLISRYPNCYILDKNGIQLRLGDCMVLKHR